MYAHEFHDEKSEQSAESGRDDSSVGENASLISETKRELSHVSVTSKSGRDISAGDVSNSVKGSRQGGSQLSLVSEPHRVGNDGSESQCVVVEESRQVAISESYLSAVDAKEGATEDKCHEVQVRPSQESAWTRVSDSASQIKKSASGSADYRSESGNDAGETAPSLKSASSAKSGLHVEHAEVVGSLSQKNAADNHSESGKDMVETAPSLKSAGSIKSGVPIEHAAVELESSLSKKSAANSADVDCQAHSASVHDTASDDSFSMRGDSAQSGTAMDESSGGKENCD